MTALSGPDATCTVHARRWPAVGLPATVGRPTAPEGRAPCPREVGGQSAQRTPGSSSRSFGSAWSREAAGDVMSRPAAAGSNADPTSIAFGDGR
jgi:hypothetical protein